MAIIEHTNKEIGAVKKGKKYASSIRFWHWLNFVIISGSLLTVLINSMLFDRSQRSFVKNELINAGAAVSDKQAGAVTHGLEDQVWAIHSYFGYALAALFLFRLIAEFFLPPAKRLFPKLKKAYHAYFILKKERETAKHELVAKGLYIIFYLLLLIMVVTGLLLAFEDYTGIPQNINHSIKEFHGFCMYLILGFIVIHLSGVFLAERKDGKGIVSDMINGGEN
ncbi:cytochrome b/b6 domain-containing protein [Pedobacter sp. MR2016-19]|uniref:cytochrome b/b6 domain-containing protein n=1 Tax=Pedobacter sp. MR2016-19 TaxID=2780089 RepID=UPI0018774D6B|nr:cytochrome b/b6 domain-containing protein [Pedobacter sp. MR2016-19]MBE5321906.1 cytochrome b/b6 domain-containing protein [Pedobacter sp. MR2016-19]